MDWSGVDYCDVFISCLDSHSDGTHSLQSEQIMQMSFLMCSNEETNESAVHRGWLLAELLLKVYSVKQPYEYCNWMVF